MYIGAESPNRLRVKMDMPASSPSIPNTPAESSEFSVIDVYLFVREHFLALLLGFFVGGILGYISAAMARPMYESSVVLIPAGEPGAGSASALGNLGGLAALAGLNLPRVDRREEYLAVLRSRSFASDFAVSSELLPTIQAESRGLVSKLLNSTLSDYDATEVFRHNIMRIEEEARSGITRVTVRWYDQMQAAEWANAVAASINSTLRERAIRDSARLVDYLNTQIQKAESLEVRQALYSALETELKSNAIAQVREDYAYRVLDPAIPSPLAVSPNLPLRVLVGCLFGTVVAILVVGIRRFKRAVKLRVQRTAALAPEAASI
jgi:uncharacterized protein involved in exopolysaccharide biosynthesis